MKNHFRTIVIICILFLYLIIIAGAVVRMTGSGMGCPDWPKCFGYYIPPTEVSQIQWQPHRNYKEGTIVIINSELRIAHHTFRSKDTYTPQHWNPYTKHDYAIFNVWHTWIEYINRLVTVLSGIPMLLMLFVSFRYWNEKKSIPIMAILTIVAMMFQAWLGKVVVDSNLLPIRITIHMVVAFIILGFLLQLLYLTKKSYNTRIPYNRNFKIIFMISVLLTLVQVGLGTQVRQTVDEQIKLVGEHLKSEWLPLTWTFYIHRSFSILVVLINGWLWLQSKKYTTNTWQMNWVIALIGLEAFTGILMSYFEFPFLSQPLHLLLSSMLFGVQFYVFLAVFMSKKKLM